jgi:hypothetical protein
MFITDDSSAKVVDPKTGKEKPVTIFVGDGINFVLILFSLIGDNIFYFYFFFFFN